MIMYFIIKRFFDFFVALISIIITFPIWLITIIGIEISDFGPVFYKARRIGYKGREFCMYKFRSMRVPKKHEEISEKSFRPDKNRIFVFGKIIRKLKIDELPQFINVLIGNMSIVGPRPASVDQGYIMREGELATINSVVPGLTGPAALYDYIYGDEIEDPDEYEKLVLPTRIQLEVYYLSHRGILFDLRMIVWTIECVFCSIFRIKNKRILRSLIFYSSVMEKNNMERG